MWSAPVTVTPPATAPVTLAAVKEFLTIESDETLHDAQLTRFIAAAAAQVEAVTGTRLVVQTVEISASEWSDLEHFPIGPVRGIGPIAWVDSAGVGQTLALEAFVPFGKGLEVGVRPATGTAWPAGLARQRDAITATLEVGYTDVPEPIQTAILIMVADLFAQRESFVVGTVAAKIPSTMQVDHLLMNYRIWL